MKRIWLLIVLFAAAAPAQTKLTLQEAVQRALSEHPLLKAGEQRIAVAHGERKQAGLSPNPQLVLQQENLRFSGSPAFPYWTETDTFAFLRQNFETKGKRQRRVEAASTAVTRAELERQLLARHIAANVKRAYWAAAGARRIHELLLEAAKNFLLIVEYHEIRVKEGAMAEADLLRIRLESERLTLAATHAALRAEQETINLYREMGEGDFPVAVVFDSLQEPGTEVSQADPQRALEDRTEMKLARLAVEQAQAGLRLEQAYSRPNVEGVLGYKRTTGLNTLMAGLQFDLPFRNRNQGRIAAASAQIAAARSELASTTAVVRAEVAIAENDYQVRRRQILESLRPMLKQATESSEIAQAAYREGGWDLLRLLDAERLRIETQSLYYQALSEYQQSIAALDTALGVEP